MKRVLVLALLVLSPLVHAATLRLGNDVVPASEEVTLSVDPRSDVYRGSVAVDLEVRRPTRSFRFHAQDLSITSLRLSQGQRPIDAVYTAGEGSTVLVTVGERLQPGRYALAVDFTNRFNRQAVGLYKMSTKDGEPYLFTQFEAIDARRAFPVWDEPAFKIPFQLTVVIPALYDAVSNTPVASESKEGETKTIRFAQTKPLPSYLLALAVGRFEYTPIEGMSVPGRVVAPKGQGHLSATAAKVTPPILAALEKYFGSTHPFEKVDLIAVPEYWAGAMENPGAITYRDTILLLDPATATPSQRQNLIRVTAHELAHMWFGDLVTMEWWNDLWLNESFADWMGDKITAQLFPELEHDISELGGVQATMTGDARATAEAIRRRDAAPEDALRSVGLAYNKGKAVLSMFEGWIGPDRFREGVLEHLKANAWGNANASQFFAALSKHAPAGTAAALETFIAQPGIPLVTVEVTGPNTVRLTQKRFSVAEVKPQSWQIPVTLRYPGGTKAVLLDAPSRTVKLDADQVAWIYPDAQATGYYRWQMSDDALATLAKQAADVLEPRERLAFIGNLGALFRSGALSGDAYLELLGNFSADRNPHVVDALLSALNVVHSTFDSDGNRPRFAAYIGRTVGPMIERIGLTPQPGEPDTLTSLRPQLISLLAQRGGDEKVWAFVREQLPLYLKDPKSVHPTLAGVIVALNGVRGDAALFEEYRKRFENAATPAERSRFLAGMREFRDPAIRARAREYALGSSVRPTELFNLIGETDTEAERDELFTWVTENYDAIMKKMPPTFAGAMPFLAGGCSMERVKRAQEFFASHQVQGTERTMARVSEQVKDCAALRAREIEAVTRYLASH